LIERVVVIVCLGLCTHYGCKDQGKTTQQKAPPVPEITIGLLPERDIFHQVQRYDPLTAYLSAKLGVNVRQKVMKQFGVRKFIATRDEDYEPVYQYAREIDLDLCTFDSTNES
jgi:ABC-type phosphate/phosphonate transport system substrate-binding protein